MVNLTKSPAVPPVAVKPVVAALPWFPGFYHTELDSFIDREVESRMEEEGLTWEEADKLCDYRAALHAISKAWAEAFAKEAGLAMEFESLESPREYNFTTDRVFVTLPPEALAELETARSSPEFAGVLKRQFTSRSGFCSFYSNDPADDEWSKPIVEWDHNQLMALIAAYVEMNGGDRESMQETIHGTSCVYEAAQHVWKA